MVAIGENEMGQSLCLGKHHTYLNRARFHRSPSPRARASKEAQKCQAELEASFHGQKFFINWWNGSGRSDYFTVETFQVPWWVRLF